MNPELKALTQNDGRDVYRRPSFDGLKIALAAPSYGPRDPHLEKHLRAAMMTASNAGIKWAGDVSSIRMAWEAGRDMAAKAAINAEADGVVWIDDDMKIPPETIVKLVAHGKDFTSGMYFQKAPPYWPLVAMFDGDSFQWLAAYPEKGQIVEVDGVGFGCCYTSTKLLKALRDKHRKIFEWTRYSEDFTFCLRAGELGMKPWVDTTIKCGHSPLEPHFITEEDFQRIRENGNGNFRAIDGGHQGDLASAPASGREPVV